jgi:cobalamin biosynthesis Mg chelatase CobN
MGFLVCCLGWLVDWVHGWAGKVRYVQAHTCHEEGQEHVSTKTTNKHVHANHTPIMDMTTNPTTQMPRQKMTQARPATRQASKEASKQASKQAGQGRARQGKARQGRARIMHERASAQASKQESKQASDYLQAELS